jgi:hypothetical protein
MTVVYIRANKGEQCFLESGYLLDATNHKP